MAWGCSFLQGGREGWVRYFCVPARTWVPKTCPAGTHTLLRPYKSMVPKCFRGIPFYVTPFSISCRLKG